MTNILKLTKEEIKLFDEVRYGLMGIEDYMNTVYSFRGINGDEANLAKWLISYENMRENYIDNIGMANMLSGLNISITKANKYKEQQEPEHYFSYIRTYVKRMEVY